MALSRISHFMPRLALAGAQRMHHRRRNKYRNVAMISGIRRRLKLTADAGPVDKKIDPAALARIFKIVSSPRLDVVAGGSNPPAELLTLQRAALPVSFDSALVLFEVALSEINTVATAPPTPIMPPGVTNIRSTPHRPGAPAGTLPH